MYHLIFPSWQEVFLISIALQVADKDYYLGSMYGINFQEVSIRTEQLCGIVRGWYVGGLRGHQSWLWVNQMLIENHPISQVT